MASSIELSSSNYSYKNIAVSEDVIVDSSSRVKKRRITREQFLTMSKFDKFQVTENPKPTAGHDVHSVVSGMRVDSLVYRVIDLDRSCSLKNEETLPSFMSIVDVVQLSEAEKKGGDCPRVDLVNIVESSVPDLFIRTDSKSCYDEVVCQSCNERIGNHLCDKCYNLFVGSRMKQTFTFKNYIVKLPRLQAYLCTIFGCSSIAGVIAGASTSIIAKASSMSAASTVPFVVVPSVVAFVGIGLLAGCGVSVIRKRDDE